MKKLSLIILLVLALAAGFAQTSFTATYDFSGGGNDVYTFAYNGTQPTGVSMGNMVKTGIRSTSSSKNFRGDEWPIVNTIDTGKHIGFTMTANPGYTFSVTSIKFGLGKSSSGPKTAEWRGSAGNFAAAIGDYSALNSGITNTNGVLTYTGSSLLNNTMTPSGYTDIISCGFNLYMYNASGTSGTGGLQGNITIEGTYQLAGSDPVLNVSPTSLDGFTYVLGNGPSTAQTFSVSGANLDRNNNITITTTGEYEVSLDNSTYPANGVTITPDANGTVAATDVYVRLKAGLPVTTYPNGYATVAYTGLASQNVYFDGSVTAPPPPRYFVDFEGPGETKGAYASGTIQLSGLNWDMTEAMVFSSPDTGDWYEGARSARLRGYGTSSMTMLEDKTNGAGTISFQYRQYGTDTQTTWKVKYSTDQGNTWQEIPFDPLNNNTFKATATVQLFSYDLNTSRNIRLRIEEATGSGGSNRRMNIDNIEITDFYDFPNGEGTQLVNDIITVSGGHGNYNYAATPGALPDPNFQASFHDCLTLLGAGPWTIDIQNSTAQWAAYKQGGTWHSTAFANGSATLTVPAAKAADIELLTGIGNNPTVPVTLSHFSATMTAENYVQLTWISQTETNLMGYNVYRNSSDDLGSARQICPMIAGTNTSQAQTYVYEDRDLVEDGTYYYWLQNVDLDGSNAFHGPVSVVFSITGDGGSPAVPTVTQLDDAYPNPFNPNTTIRYQLEGAGKVKINIYNTRGQLVRSFERGHDAAGHFSIVWDGRDSSGRELPSGVYLYNMSSGRYSSSKKMVLKK